MKTDMPENRRRREDWLRSEAELDKVKCRFGCDDLVHGIYHVPEGCHCWEDPIQALCWQHASKAESTGPITALIFRRMAPPHA